MAISLRDYQTDAIRATIKARDQESITRPLISLPTGTGKTLVFSELAKQLKAKTLIVAHRQELIRQAADKVSMIWPEASIGIIKAQQNDFKEKNVVCASVQTIYRTNRLNQIRDQGFNFLVIDEAHHSCAQSYLDIINGLGFKEDDPEKLLLGVSATCFRADKKGLGHIYQKVVYQASILTMIRAGYLSDIRGYRAQTKTDLSAVRTSHGDFIESQLATAVNTDERNQLVVDSYFEHAPKRKAIAFCASVEHANDLSTMFNNSGIVAKALSCNTPDEERQDTLKAFKEGDIQILTNCALFTEGFDEPSISCVLMCRPTKSPIFYTQCIGRGTRKYPSKQDCIIIDFCDNRHDICSLPLLLGFNNNSLTKGESVLETKDRQSGCGNKYYAAPASDDISIQEFDLLGKSVFRWIHDGQKWRLPVSPGVYTILTPAGIDRYQVHLYQKDGKSELLHTTALSLGYGQGICEDYARQYGRAFSRRDSAWRDQEATDKQVNLLVKLGIDPDGMTKGVASDALEEFFARQEARKNMANISQ